MIAPEVRTAQRWNIVWAVPVLALLLGGWLIYRNFTSRGAVAEVRFETANGIYAGKTEVRCRSVKVGVVKDVKLADSMKSVIAYIEMDPDTGGLLRRSTQFWVVKPRFSVTEFSGAETIITGAYIELDPGATDSEPWNLFEGLETPPATSSGIPGLRLSLTADEAGSLNIGAPVYYRGFDVGRIEARNLDANGLNVTYNAFIREEHRHLVTEYTRFWNTSGVDISAGADGFKLRTPSLQAMLSGGVSFGVIAGDNPGKTATNGMNFTLFRDEDSAQSSVFNPTMKFLLLFDQTIRGLSNRAPVEFRGITIGRVASFSFDLVPASGDPRIPVLIEIDPKLMPPYVAQKMSTPDTDFLKGAVSDGLRASLKSGSLLTGALFVDLDYYTDKPPATLGKVGDYTTIPTIPSGLAQLEAKITAILDKVQALPIDQTMTDIAAAAAEAKVTIAESRSTLKEIEATAAAARTTLEDPSFRQLPTELKKSLDDLQKTLASAGPDGAMQGDLLRTLDELRAALRSLKSMTTTIDEKPSSVIWGRDSSPNTTPKAPAGKR